MFQLHELRSVNIRLIVNLRSLDRIVSLGVVSLGYTQHQHVIRYPEFTTLKRFYTFILLKHYQIILEEKWGVEGIHFLVCGSLSPFISVWFKNIL